MAPRPEPVAARRSSAEGLGRLAAALVPHDAGGLRLQHRLRLLTIGLRWITVIAGTLAGALRDAEGRFLLTTAGLVGLAAVVTVRQMQAWRVGPELALTVVVELGLTVTAAALTGGLESPFILTPLTGLLLAGYVFGRRASIGTATAGLVAAGATIVIQSVGPGHERSASQIAVVYLLCGTLGAFTRNLVVEIEAHRAAAIDQATQMATANELLVSLHALAQTLPASLDLGEVVVSIRDRLRALLPFTVLVVLVRDDTGAAWRVELAEGVRVQPGTVTDPDLPAPLARAAGSRRTVVVRDRLADADDGFAALTRSGLYTTLQARGAVVGLIALEHVPAHAYRREHADVLDNLSAVLALSVDNARWFGRIRTLGAEVERARIARELHDRVAQSLAYVTFELERLQVVPGEKHTELAALHQVVRGIVGELRETIYQLRAHVTEDSDLVAVAADYLVRWTERTGVRVVWEPATGRRLPYRVEQELWRILQETLANVERHAQASEVVVSWDITGDCARLVVADDGVGFEPDAVTGDHYGIVGMRERADAIGARLHVDSRAGHGTRVTVDVALGRTVVDARERRSA